MRIGVMNENGLKWELHVSSRLFVHQGEVKESGLPKHETEETLMI